MPVLIDSFWRAVAYCLLPRVILLSLLPLALMVALTGGLAYFYWTPLVDWMRQALDAWPLLSMFWNWIERLGAGDVKSFIAPMVVIFIVTPVLVILAVLVVAVMLTPTLTNLVAGRRFPDLERKRGGSLIGSIVRTLGATLLALLAFVVSMPLWLIPPLVLVLPPLIWGWLTYRIMSFDALAEHASSEERETLLRAHRWQLLGIGMLCGYLGAAPSIVWASGVLFAAAFVVLIPLAIWIYMLVFAFSTLWFAHYCLEILSRLRAHREQEATHAPAAATPAERQLEAP